jgi:hypothetical protein
MKKVVSVLSVVFLVMGLAGTAAAAPGHGGHGGVSRPAAVPHAAPRAVAPRAAAPRVGRGAWHDHRHGFHRGGGGVFVGVTPFWWDPFPAPVYAPPPVVVQEPPVYVEPTQPGYWYYCPSAGGYYPSVPSCPEPWVPVPPTGG